ncbi:hypothetical protein M9458_007850 [Cirrhinus mrigala]|uniref:Gypsy retrotransposon integrase-like protein 1 n=1 Tax=Cirrhinus mrigala TaxID=683832 RepID=A0ABD0RPG2_CIRMR
MEVVQTSSVKIPNAVIISGITGTESDEHVYDFLKQYGSIHRIIPVDSSESETDKQVIVEYAYGTAVQSLSSILPHKLHQFHARTQANTTYLIRTLASAYTPVVSKSVTQTYLSELKELAKLTGRDLTTILKEELSIISEAVDLDNPMKSNSPNTQEHDITEATAQVSPPSSTVREPFVQPEHNWSPPLVSSERKTQPALKLSDVSPPEVQRVIVEHIVRNEESAMQFHAPLRLRPFSGRCPHPNNEVNYETWRANVELLLKDTKQPDLYKSRKLLESLSSPAIDIVKHLTPESPPGMYLEILDSAFGTVEDGDDSFAKYLNTVQDNGEKPSAYLQRLQVMLNTAFRRGEEVEPTYLCRTSPVAPHSRRQKDLQSIAYEAVLQCLKAESVYFQYEEECIPSQSTSYSKNEVQDLKRQIADLQSQLTRITQRDSQKTSCKPAAKPVTPKPAIAKSAADAPLPQKSQSHSRDANTHRSNRPKPWYCFRCGEDGHIKPQCEAEPNPSLVASKREQLREKQLSWDIENVPVPVGGQTGTETQAKCPKKKHCSSYAHSQSKGELVTLPKGLIGAKCTAQVTVGRRRCNCLLDTGSQVTTIPNSFYQENLSHLPIESLNNLLEIEGANGQEVPYIGYVETTIKFPRSLLGKDIEVPTLALIVPDMRSTLSSVLIGTNTLDALYEQYADTAPQDNDLLPYGCKVVLKTLEVRKRWSVDSSLGEVRLHSSRSETIAAGQTQVHKGTVNYRTPNAGRWVMVESPKSAPLPGGMLVTDSIANLPTKLSRCIPVILKNESNHDITLSPKAVIGEIHAIKSVQSIESSTSDSQTKPDHKPNLSFDFGNSPVPSEWKERIIKRLNSMPEVFAQHELDFGRTDKVKHRINLNDKTPFKHRARPVHPQDIEAVRNHLHQLLDAEIIRESESPFSSPIVVVRKKNGDVRLCIDYRKLNLQTVKDSYALPNLEESFSALTGSKWFSVMDLKSGFYQIEMEEADKHKTAFVCPLGFFEFNRMPQGITNAPSTFQRLMERCIGELNLKQALVFLDDLIVFSSTLEEHEERLLRVLNRLKEYGLKLSPEKCKFFQTSVKYLGHIVSTKGIETDPEKIAALKTWPKPNNLKELRTFLGFCGYYRRFIKGYSKMVKPLNELTAGYPPLRKRISAAGKAKRYHNPKDLFGDRWTPACQAAFDTLIEKLTDAPILGFADPKLPYILHTDASTSGLGAALYQEQQGQKRVIAYASRGLSKCESKYPAHKLEFLALKWAITEKFQDYLYGSSFLVVTDSNPLTYILTSAKLDATSYRWLAALSTFDFQLQYRAGKQNQDADGLSRRPHSRLPDDALSQKEVERIQQFTKRHLGSEHVTMNENTVKAILINNPPAETSPKPTLVVSLAHHPKALPESFEEEDQFGGLPVIAPFAPEDIRERQRADTCICEILRQMETGETVSPSLRKEIPELGLLLRKWSKLKILNGILYRKRQEGIQTYHQLVLPETLRPLVLKSLHDDMGHMGVERTLDLVRKRFYWPKMSADVESRIKTCHRCVRRKSLPEKAAPLVNITATRPLELVCMDFLSVEPGSNNIKDILVITDHFTKYAVTVPTPNQKARTVAKCLWDHFFVHYGIPEKLLSDQGPDFESRIIKELCELIGTQKVRTTPYHPRGNPVERFNRTLLNMLGTLENRKKNQWRNYVKPLVHAYNCTKNEVTGFTPYELMFGRQPRLPIDLALGLPINHQPGSHSQYVNNLRSQLQESYRLATKSAKKTADRNRTRFDKHVVNSTLKEGDRVLVRNVRLRGKHKLADRWESDVYVVLKQSEGVPVYVVRPETREGPQRTLHRDLLLPCGFLPMTQVEDEADNTKVARRPRTRQYPNSDLSGETDEDDPQSDLEGCYVDGPRNITVETVGTDNISSIVKYLPGKRDSVPSAALTAAGHSPSDVTKAFPNDPVQVYNPNLPDLEERNLPDPGDRNLLDAQERNLPDPEERNLPDPEERSLPSPVEDNLPVGQRSDIPEREKEVKI